MMMMTKMKLQSDQLKDQANAIIHLDTQGISIYWTFNREKALKKIENKKSLSVSLSSLFCKQNYRIYDCVQIEKENTVRKYTRS